MAIKRFSSLALAGLVSLLTACASVPTEQGPVWPYPEPPESGSWGDTRPRASAPDTPEAGRYEQPAATQNSSTAESYSQGAQSSHPTVAALVSQAEDEKAQGELESASATLERAIRIVPNDPVPWLKLAELRFEEGNLIQAENFARRSLSYAAQGASAREAWLLIADIKRLQGNDAAAETARRNAQST